MAVVRRSSTPPGRGHRRPSAGEAGIRISDAATRAGVSARTLRYYEELGLLTPSLYTPGGERRYTPDDLTQLDRILELREVLGMNLDEIKEFLSLETRLDELRATYRATKGGTTQEGPGRAEGDAARRRSCSTSRWPSSSTPSWPAWTRSGPSWPARPSAAGSCWPSWTKPRRSNPYAVRSVAHGAGGSGPWDHVGAPRLSRTRRGGCSSVLPCVYAVGRAL